MAMTVACWILNAVSIIITMGTSGYYVACLNPDLMKDYLFIWVSLLVMGVASVIEFLYFMAALVMLIMGTSCNSLVQTLTNLVTMYDPALQIIGDVGFLVTIILFDPIKGSDDGIFQVIIVFLVGGVKMFLTYATMLLNYDASFYYSETPIMYANVPTQETELKAPVESTVEVEPAPEPTQTEKPAQTQVPTVPQVAIIREGRLYLVPAGNLVPVYGLPK